MARKLKVTYENVFAPDGTPWKRVAEEAHSLAAEAIVTLAEVRQHADARFESELDSYNELTERLYPGSLTRTQELELERQLALQEEEALGAQPMGGQPGIDIPVLVPYEDDLLPSEL